MADLDTIADYSETAGSNDNVDGVNIAENCSMANMNNAMREIMVDLAQFTGADTVASASSIDLSAVPGQYVVITGTTTITAMGTVKDGYIKYLKFSGALTLTHNATSLILPEGQNITTTAGDTGIFVSEGSGNWRCISFQFHRPNVGGNRLAPHENLLVRYVTAATADIDADAILVKNTAGQGVRLSSVNLTVDITASGANGLDTGSEASSTMYHLYVIYNGTTTAGLLSTSASSPTMPSGYTFKGYVGAVYNNSSSNLEKFIQRGNHVDCVGILAVNGGTATTYTAVDCSTILPATASTILIQPGIRSSSGTNQVTLYYSPQGSGTTPTEAEAFVNAITDTQIFYFSKSDVICKTLTPSTAFYYYVSGTNAQCYIYVRGWEY